MSGDGGALSATDAVPKERKKRGTWTDGLDGCSALFDGGCCLLGALSSIVLVATPLLLLLR